MGALYVFPGKPNFPPLPDLSGKVVVVTGGNRGLGYEICRQLLSSNAKVYLTARSKEKGLEAVEKLKQSTGKSSIDFLQLDMGYIASIDAAVSELLAKEPSLHILINNAAPVLSQAGETTLDGIEVNIGTAVLGHHVLAMGLLPALRNAAKDSPRGSVRIVSVGSAAMFHVPAEIPFDQLDNANPRHGIKERHLLYGRSKRVMYLWGQLMTEKYASEGIFTYTVHPGIIKSPGLVEPNRLDVKITLAIWGRPISEGAGQIVWVSIDPTLKADDSGSLYIQWMKKKAVKKVSRAQLEGVWDWVEERRHKFSKGSQ